VPFRQSLLGEAERLLDSDPELELGHQVLFYAPPKVGIWVVGACDIAPQDPRRFGELVDDREELVQEVVVRDALKLGALFDRQAAGELEGERRERLLVSRVRVLVNRVIGQLADERVVTIA